MIESGYNEEVQGWLDAVLVNRGIDAEQTLRSCGLIEKYSLPINDEWLLGFAYYYAGETYYALNDIEHLFQYMIKSLGYLESSGQWDLAARAYNLLAITSVNQGNALFAMDYYLKGLTYCQKHGIANVGIIVNINIGTLYLTFGEHEQAQHYFEQSHQLLKINSDCDGYHSYLTMVYLGLAKCCMYQNILDKAEEYTEKVQNECGVHLEDIEHLENINLLIIKAKLYNLQDKKQQRDECIQNIQERTSDKFALMDLFDEFYEYSDMLFEIGKYDEFKSILTILENLTSQAKIINLQRRVLTLKIKYCRKIQDNTAYFKATGLFYEMSEAMEKENQYVISIMLNVRRSLDDETKVRQEIQKENEVLMEKSETDALTGLNNRFRFDTYANEAFLRSLECRGMLGIEILDIDFFKQYNDNYGHQAGDKCLIQVANKMKELEKQGQIKGFRYGGDEFVIIFEECDRNQIQCYMEELKESIMELNLEHKFSQACHLVTISQGACADVPEKGQSFYDFLHTADTMLYKVKEQSRNSIAIGGCENPDK